MPFERGARATAGIRRTPATGLLPGSLVALAVAVSSACGDDARPPPAGFGMVTPTDGGSGGSTTGGRGGTRSTGGVSGDAGAQGGGDEAGTTGKSGNSGRGGQGGASQAGGEAGVNQGGHNGANGGGGNETAEGGAFLTGPDLACPKPTPSTPSTPYLCDPNAEWSAGDPALPDGGGLDLLLSITPSELTVAWRYLDAIAPKLYIADRASVDDDFGTPVELSDATLSTASQIGLAPSGLRLVAVINNRFVEYSRPTLADPFLFVGEGYFELVNADAGKRALSLADPVLLPDDATLYYSLLGPGVDATIQVSKRMGLGNFAVGSPLDECEVDHFSTGARRPSGVSADGLTLFYYDEPRAMQRAAWRPALDRPFDRFADQVGLLGAQPNQACDALYYSQMTTTGLDLLRATAP